jgi:hypothetical protein
MEKISTFLDRLGFPLHNTRWSWGARSDLGVLLTTWAEDLDESGRYGRTDSQLRRAHFLMPVLRMAGRLGKSGRCESQTISILPVNGT